MNFLELNLPSRSERPRNIGLTMVIDGGISMEIIESYIRTSAQYIDYVKLGWGTSIVTNSLEKKIELYHNYDIPVCLGGTLFEVAYIQGKADDYVAKSLDIGVDIIEISDGTIEMKESEKLIAIEGASKKIKVISEYGSKDSSTIQAPMHWVRGMKNELEAGSWKVIAEGRESGTSGLYRGSSELRTGLVEELVRDISQDRIIWEAPQKAQQVWFIKEFGHQVNLGNIKLSDTIALETLRLGLRGDTLLDFHNN